MGYQKFKVIVALPTKTMHILIRYIIYFGIRFNDVLSHQYLMLQLTDFTDHDTIKNRTYQKNIQGNVIISRIGIALKKMLKCKF